MPFPGIISQFNHGVRTMKTFFTRKPVIQVGVRSEPILFKGLLFAVMGDIENEIQTHQVIDPHELSIIRERLLQLVMVIETTMDSGTAVEAQQVG